MTQADIEALYAQLERVAAEDTAHRLLPYGHALHHTAANVKAVYLCPQVIEGGRAWHWVRFEYAAFKTDDFDLVYSEAELRGQFTWAPPSTP